MKTITLVPAVLLFILIAPTACSPKVQKEMKKSKDEALTAPLSGEIKGTAISNPTKNQNTPSTISYEKDKFSNVDSTFKDKMEGRELFASNCGSCHQLYWPRERPVAEWTTILDSKKQRDSKIPIQDFNKIKAFVLWQSAGN